mgnify:CR=1 FL=1
MGGLLESQLEAIYLTDTVRIARPDLLSWELQVFGDFSTPNVKKALEKRGKKSKEGWRSVGFYSTPRAAALSLLTKYPDLLMCGNRMEAKEFVDRLEAIADRCVVKLLAVAA